MTLLTQTCSSGRTSLRAAVGALPFALICACTSPKQSAAPTPSASPWVAPASPITVVRVGRLIDGRGGPPVENAVLILDGPLVRTVGPADPRSIPAAATTVDLSDKTVFPGLVSDHSHVGMVDGTKAGASNYTRSNVLRQLGQFEAYGVTTVTSLGLNSAVFYEVQPGLHTGALAGADLFGADRGVGVPDAAPPVDADRPNLYRPNTSDEARAAVREMAGRRPSFIKIWVDDFHGKLPAKMTPAMSSAVIDEAHRLGLRVAAHVFYLDDAKELVAAGVDVLAHGVRDRPVDDAFIQAMKAHRTWYIPTLGLDESFYLYAEQPERLRDPFLQHALQRDVAAQLGDSSWRTKALADAPAIKRDKDAVRTGLANIKTLYDAGVSIGFGTDSGATPLRVPGFAEHRELQLMTQAGLTPLQAIRVATHDAATLLGLQDRGTLEAGKLADFVVVEGDPSERIEDTTRIAAVWHRGRPIGRGVDAFAP